MAAVAVAGCVKEVEREHRPAGSPCGGDHVCADGLRCYQETCMTSGEVAQAKEQRMFQASGVDPATVPAEARGAAPGAAVRVVRVIEESSAFAACRSTERLVGGSCEGGDGGPDRYGADDTIGARWRCRSTNPGWKVTAYALCARVEVRETPPEPPPIDAGR
jgi:hypothetical protein